MYKQADVIPRRIEVFNNLALKLKEEATEGESKVTTNTKDNNVIDLVDGDGKKMLIYNGAGIYAWNPPNDEGILC